MGAISQQLGVAMQSMDTMQIAQSMDQFERQLNDLDVQGTMIGTVMDSSTANSTPVDEVDSLISQVADEAGMSLADKFPEMVQGDAAAAAQPAERSQVCHCPRRPLCESWPLPAIALTADCPIPGGRAGSTIRSSEVRFIQRGRLQMVAADADACHASPLLCCAVVLCGV